MRRRFDLTNFEWSVIEPLLPNKSRGADDPLICVKNYLSGRYSPPGGALAFAHKHANTAPRFRRARRLRGKSIKFGCFCVLVTDHDLDWDSRTDADQKCHRSE